MQLLMSLNISNLFSLKKNGALVSIFYEAFTARTELFKSEASQLYLHVNNLAAVQEWHVNLKLHLYIIVYDESERGDHLSNTPHTMNEHYKKANFCTYLIHMLKTQRNQIFVSMCLVELNQHCASPIDNICSPSESQSS